MSWYVKPGYVRSGYVFSGVSGGSGFAQGSHAADGSVRVTVVDGTTYTGLYAADGSINVIPVDGSTFTGMQDGCGAMNVFSASADWTFGIIHACGALVVSESPYKKGTIPITIVSEEQPPVGLAAPSIVWDEEAGDHTADFDITAAFELNDTIEAQRDSVNTFITAEDAEDLVIDDISEGADHTLVWPSSWEPGTYYVRARYLRDSATSPWSATETVTIV